MSLEKLSFEDYENAKSTLLNYAEKRKDISAIWQYGEVSQPGVSDLDLIALIKEKCDLGIADYLEKAKLDPMVQDAMAHANLIIVPETTAKGVLYWDDIKIRNVKDGIPINDPEDLNLSFRRMAMLVDWLFERTYRIFSMRKHVMPKQQRWGLGLMKSFGYCVDNYKMVNPNADTTVYSGLIYRITELRHQWLTMKTTEKEKQFLELADDFFEFVVQFHREIFEYLSQSEFYPDWNDSWLKHNFTFPDGMEFSFEDTYSKRDDGVIVLPKKLLNHFSLYASSGSKLSNILQQSFNEAPAAPSDNIFFGEYRNFLQRRIDVASHWYDFLKFNGFTYGLFKFGWYLPKKN